MTMTEHCKDDTQAQALYSLDKLNIKYIINELYANGYERYALIEKIDNSTKFTVYFLEYDEYIASGEASQKRKAGDILEGEITIDLVTASKKTDEEIMYRQTIPKSSHIEAIVQVHQIIDDYSAYVISSIIDDTILVEFEHAVDYIKGDKIYIEGSLEMRKIE